MILTPTISYQLVRSKRRTLGLEIRDNGALIVRAPLKASQKDIDALIREKQHWIVRHQTQSQQQKQLVPPKQFVTGEYFRYLDQLYPLWVTEQERPRFYFDNGFYLAGKYQNKAEKFFLQWYYQQAQYLIHERAKYYAEREGLRYHSIRVNNPRRQWGACSFDGKLSFNWRLIMAPLSVIDYVVVHELAHLVWKNHSIRFWRKVEKMYPEFQQARRWLRDNGYLLTL